VKEITSYNLTYSKFSVMTVEEFFDVLLAEITAHNAAFVKVPTGYQAEDGSRLYFTIVPGFVEPAAPTEVR